MDRNRMYLLIGAGLAAIAVVVVLILVGTGGSSSTTTSGVTTTATPSANLTGIPQKNVTLGRATAPVTVEVFEDPQCPYCKEWNVGTLPTVVKDYVRPGKIKLVFRGINIVGSNSEVGLLAIYAAGLQGKAWQMADELYLRQGTENSGWINDASITSAAQAAGANVNSISAAFQTAPVIAMLNAARRAATAYSIQGTPSFVVQRPPGRPTQLQLSGLDPASFAAALDPLLQ